MGIKVGDQLQYAINGRESNAEVNGTMMIYTEAVTSSTYTVTYRISLDGEKTTWTNVTFIDASGDWSSNIANVIERLSGSSDSGAMVNTTSFLTKDGDRNLTGIFDIHLLHIL